MYKKLSEKLKEVTETGNELVAKMQKQRQDFKNYNEKLVQSCKELTKLSK